MISPVSGSCGPNMETSEGGQRETPESYGNGFGPNMATSEGGQQRSKRQNGFMGSPDIWAGRESVARVRAGLNHTPGLEVVVVIHGFQQRTSEVEMPGGSIHCVTNPMSI